MDMFLLVSFFFGEEEKNTGLPWTGENLVVGKASQLGGQFFLNWGQHLFLARGGLPVAKVQPPVQ